jgi:hypothetical protein
MGKAGICTLFFDLCAWVWVSYELSQTQQSTKYKAQSSSLQTNRSLPFRVGRLRQSHWNSRSPSVTEDLHLHRLTYLMFVENSEQVV